MTKEKKTTQKTLPQEKLIIYDDKKRIGSKEAKYLKEKFLHNLIVGTEMETQNHDSKKRDKLREILNPNKEYGCYNKTGVHSVITDGSLHSSGNVEVIYSGTNFGTEEMIEQINYIEQSMLKMNKYNKDGTLKEGFYTDRATGQHMSILQIKPFQVPEIIGRNAYQIMRIFSSNLAHLTATGTGETPLRSNSLSYAKLPKVSAKGRTFRELIQKINNEGAGGKSGFLNLGKTISSNDDQMINDLFLELRMPDRIMSATIEASIMQLLKAILMKACTVSTKGLILAKQEFWDDQKNVYEIMQTKNKELVWKELGKALTEQTITFLKFLRTELDEIDTALYPVLIKLAKEPLWSCHKNNPSNDKHWTEIEKNFNKEFKKQNPNKTEKKLLELISLNDEFLNGITEETMINEWSKELKIKPETTKEKIKALKYEWNKEERTFTRRK